MENAETDVIVFIALLDIYVKCGRNNSAFRVFQSMPSRNGKGTDVLMMFDQMVKEVKPDYVTFIALLEEADAEIRGMTMSPNEIVRAYRFCSVHRKLELRERLKQELVQMYPQNTEYHVLLSNVKAQPGTLEMADSLRKVLKTRGIGKFPRISSMHIGGKVLHFSPGNKSHP
ncbi:unnamed protein product [Fraxinus pennsylvanica]|uniref:Pentatricopeptide repeat-containing protein n=1 Tax=Fraxinus pennsylvanica TaxID=56036 RepID=A0AAD2A8I2_9LAMI|nr:unnamed protein product [Fraxinus pennsylvanica]